MLRISWINDQIAVGGAFLNGDIAEIKRQAIEAILDVRSEYCDDEAEIKRFNVQFLHVKIDDRYTPTHQQLKEIFSFVNPILDKGKKILIHCQNGYGRSPLIAIAILVKRGMDVADAVNLIEEKHPIVSFSLQQERFIYTDLINLLKNNYQHP